MIKSRSKCNSLSILAMNRSRMILKGSKYLEQITVGMDQVSYFISLSPEWLEQLQKGALGANQRTLEKGGSEKGNPTFCAYEHCPNCKCSRTHKKYYGTVQRFFKTLKVKLSYDSKNTHFGFISKNLTAICTSTCKITHNI